jgi:hypothetical protein
MVSGMARRSSPIEQQGGKYMTLKPLKSPRPLKPFRSFLPEPLRRRIRRGKATGKALKEEQTLEGTIKGGSAIVLGSKASDDERATLIDEFFEDINDMEGEKVFAIAVAFD